MKEPPLIAHIIYRLGIGGLENGVVNLINKTPPNRYRHAIIALTDATDFSRRLHQQGTPVYCLKRKPGKDFGMFVRLFKLLKQIQPDLVHTRNLAAVECQLPAWLAGVRHRVHGEHGWDVFDPDGSNRKYQWLRRLFSPLIQRYIPLSEQLERYLVERVGIPASKITRICNGVDMSVFHPLSSGKAAIPGCPFPNSPELMVFGAIGRMHGVKDQITLVKAFLHLVETHPQAKAKARLILVGDGPLRAQAQEMLSAAGLGDLAWLPGERHDVAEILRGMDLFVLPSQAEGISNTILEAMATALPVLATAVGGNPSLVVDGVTGTLVPSTDPPAMAGALATYLDQPAIRSAHGKAGLARTRDQFSLEHMVDQYLSVYDKLLQTC